MRSGLVVACGVALSHGAFVEFPIEHVDDLTFARFEEEYVKTMTPVLIRGNDRTRAEAARWGVEDVAKKCGDGGITRYVSDGGKDWGGFDHDTSKKVPFKILVEEMKRSDATEVYGFDYNLKCDCPDMVEEMTSLPYFKQDITNQAPHGAAWPVLIAGNAGTRSQLHVDNSFLPFWLTLLSGEKVFRCVHHDEWQAKLVPAGVLNAAGDVKVAIDSYNDAYIEEHFAGATVYSSTLFPGDSVYIPVAGLHGGSNVGTTPALAVTGNYHDAAHSDLLLRTYCDPEMDKRVARGREKSRLRAMIKETSCLFMAGVLGSTDPVRRDDGDVDAFRPLGDVVYDPAFCPKYAGHDGDCPAAAARCPAAPAEANEESDFISDKNGDGRLTRDEVALKFAQVSPQYLAGDHDDVSLAELRDWVQAEVEKIWPLAHKEDLPVADLDKRIRDRFFAEIDAEEKRDADPAPPPKKRKTAAASGEVASCGGWAAAGECAANPSYMLKACPKACAAVAPRETPSPRGREPAPADSDEL